MEKSPQVVPAASSTGPVSLTFSLSSAFLQLDKSTLWRVRSVRAYADSKVGRYRVYAVLEPAKTDPFDGSDPVTCELVGEGPDLFSAFAALAMQIFQPCAALVKAVDDRDQDEHADDAPPPPNIGYGMPGNFGAPEGGR